MVILLCLLQIIPLYNDNLYYFIYNLLKFNLKNELRGPAKINIDQRLAKINLLAIYFNYKSALQRIEKDIFKPFQISFKMWYI